MKMEKDFALCLLHNLIKKHGEQRHFDALVALGFQVNMSKDEAISLMKRGYHVTHDSFCNNEHITYVNKGNDEYYVLTEEGYKIPENEFWAYRRSNVWDKGYKRV